MLCVCLRARACSVCRRGGGWRWGGSGPGRRAGAGITGLVWSTGLSRSKVTGDM